jgi:ornithine cyclodeaminase
MVQYLVAKKIQLMMIRRTMNSSILFLSESDVKRCFSMKDCIEVNRKALMSLCDNGGGTVPTRIGLPYHASSSSNDLLEDWTLFKPASFRQDDKSQTSYMGMKLVSVRSDNPHKGLPLVPATILLVDPPTGQVEAMVSATYLTAARTAAGSALSAQWIQNFRGNSIPSNQHLVIFGAGLQAECHLEALTCVIPNISSITIINRRVERAENLAQKQKILTKVVCLQDHDQVSQACRDADWIVACTNTPTPLWDGSWLKSGCHVMGVGSYTPDSQEVDHITVQRSSIVLVDTLDASTVGDLKAFTGPLHLLGDVLREPNHIQPSGLCTFYKSVGTAIQDVFSARWIVDQAYQLHLGQRIEQNE